MTENLYHQGARREYMRVDGRYYWSQSGSRTHTWAEMTQYYNEHIAESLIRSFEQRSIALPPEKLAEFLAEKLLGNVWEEK